MRTKTEKRGRAKKQAHVEDDVTPAKTKKRSRAKQEIDVGDDDVPAMKKKRGRVKKEAEVEHDDGPAPKKAKTAAKKGKGVKIENDSEGEVKAKHGRQKAANPKLDGNPNRAMKSEADEGKPLAAIPIEKGRSSHKAVPKTLTSKNVNSDNNEPGFEADKGDEATEVRDEEDEDEVEAPEAYKAKKSRKPTVKKAAKGTGAHSETAVKPTGEVTHPPVSKKNAANVFLQQTHDSRATEQ